MSVALGNEAGDGLDVLAGHPGFALCSFLAAAARELSLGVSRDPLPNASWHALVFANHGEEIQRPPNGRISKAAQWVVQPGPEQIEAVLAERTLTGASYATANCTQAGLIVPACVIGPGDWF